MLDQDEFAAALGAARQTSDRLGLFGCEAETAQRLRPVVPGQRQVVRAIIGSRSERSTAPTRHATVPPGAERLPYSSGLGSGAGYGQLLRVSAALGSLIAVLGTLLGSFSTYLFQQRTAVRAEAVAREERLRQERLTACSEFAGAVTELKRAVVAVWLRRSDPAELKQARVEADRLGALAETARFRLRLVSGQPEPLADAAFAHMDVLRGAADLAELKIREAEFEVAVSAFITAAAERLAVPRRHRNRQIGI
jgi:hypothetical protein